jgi:hypothetical protein
MTRLVWVTLAIVGVSLPAAAQPPGAEARAVAFLAREVPRWKAENDCYSCHNNGDAARALIAAAARGHAVGAAMDDTLEWLRHPLRWNDNKTQGGIDDKPLARIQFASALRLAVEAGRAPREALQDAVRIVAADQQPDGSWRLDTSQSLGSPATYGTALATAVARLALAAAPGDDSRRTLDRADAWLRSASTEIIVDAAAVILGLAGSTDGPARAQRARALATLASGQAPHGGWGPYVTVGPEVFDTALAVTALDSLAADPALAAPAYSPDALADAIARGRAFLIAEQLSDGSWQETTRPANQESYAQRISTTGWALLALLATDR